MGSSPESGTGKPIYNNTSTTQADLQTAADYAKKTGNRRTGTTTERNAATDVWNDIVWGDSTDGNEYKRVGGSWVLLTTLGLADDMGLRLIHPTSATGTGTVSLGANGKVTFSGSTTISLNGIFSAAYDNYLMLVTMTTANAQNNIVGRWRGAGADYAGALHRNITRAIINGASTESITPATTATSALLGQVSGAGGSTLQVDFWTPYPAVEKTLWSRGHSSAGMNDSGSWAPSTSGVTDGFSILTSGLSSTITGSVRVYAYNNG